MNEEGRQFLGKLGVDSIDSLSQEQVSDIMEKYEHSRENSRPTSFVSAASLNEPLNSITCSFVLYHQSTPHESFHILMLSPNSETLPS